MKNKHKHRDGRWHDDFVVGDGDEVWVPLHLADGYRGDLVRSFSADAAVLDAHRPGFRVADQASRDVVADARRGMIDQARSGWRMDKRRPPDDPDDDDEDEDDVEDSVRAPAVRARRCWV